MRNIVSAIPKTNLAQVVGGTTIGNLPEQQPNQKGFHYSKNFKVGNSQYDVSFAASWLAKKNRDDITKSGIDAVSDKIICNDEHQPVEKTIKSPLSTLTKVSAGIPESASTHKPKGKANSFSSFFSNFFNYEINTSTTKNGIKTDKTITPEGTAVTVSKVSD